MSTGDKADVIELEDRDVSKHPNTDRTLVRPEEFEEDLNAADHNPLLRSDLDDDELSSGAIPARWKDEHFREITSHATRLPWKLIKVLSAIAIVGLAAIVFGLIVASRNRSTLASPAVQPESPVNHASSWQGFDKIENWFAFGDSWTTNAFDRRVDPEPTFDNPFGITDRVAKYHEYENYVGYLTLKYNHTRMRTFDIAWSASTIDNAYHHAYLPFLDLKNQVDEAFLGLGFYTTNETGTHKPKGWHAQNTLFSSFFGINDVLVFDRKNPQWDETFVSYEKSLDDLYEAGARNFVVLNCPPMDRSPGTAVEDHPPTFREVIVNFNHRVARMTENLRKKHADIVVFDVDVWGLFTRILDDPRTVNQTTQVKDTRTVCPEYHKKLEMGKMASPEQVRRCNGLTLGEFLWKDPIHCTYPAHDAIAAAIEQVLMNDPQTPT